MARTTLHLIATHPSHVDLHVDPVNPRVLGVYVNESAALVAGRYYLREHPGAWLQIQGEHGSGQDVDGDVAP